MNTVNIHEAKTQLSRLVERAAQGEPFVVAKAGKPLVKVSAVDAPAEPKRLGFLEGEIEVPDDFDHMGEREIAALFEISA
jgi:prevent-host-death family protein